MALELAPLVVAFLYAVQRRHALLCCVRYGFVGVALGCDAAGAAVEGAIACATAVCTAAANSSCARFAAAGTGRRAAAARSGR